MPQTDTHAQSQSATMGQQRNAVHVESKVLEMTIEVVGGSPTRVWLGIPECGGFLAAYGSTGPEKLGSLKEAIGLAARQWFERNPGNFSIPSSGASY